MPLRWRHTPPIDGGTQDVGVQKYRPIRVEVGTYATPFWIRFDSDDSKVVKVGTLPFQGQAVFSHYEILSADPNALLVPSQYAPGRSAPTNGILYSKNFSVETVSSLSNASSDGVSPWASYSRPGWNYWDGIHAGLISIEADPDDYSFTQRIRLIQPFFGKAAWPDLQFTEANISAGTDTITIAGHPFDGQGDYFFIHPATMGGTIPGGITQGIYYVGSVSGNDFKLYTDSARLNVVDLTAATGTGKIIKYVANDFFWWSSGLRVAFEHFPITFNDNPWDLRDLGHTWASLGLRQCIRWLYTFDSDWSNDGSPQWQFHKGNTQIDGNGTPMEATCSAATDRFTTDQTHLLAVDDEIWLFDIGNGLPSHAGGAFEGIPTLPSSGGVDRDVDSYVKYAVASVVSGTEITLKLLSGGGALDVTNDLSGAAFGMSKPRGGNEAQKGHFYALLPSAGVTQGEIRQAGWETTPYGLDSGSSQWKFATGSSPFQEDAPCTFTASTDLCTVTSVPAPNGPLKFAEGQLIAFVSTGSLPPEIIAKASDLKAVYFVRNPDGADPNNFQLSGLPQGNPTVDISQDGSGEIASEIGLIPEDLSMANENRQCLGGAGGTGTIALWSKPCGAGSGAGGNEEKYEDICYVDQLELGSGSRGYWIRAFHRQLTVNGIRNPEPWRFRTSLQFPVVRADRGSPKAISSSGWVNKNLSANADSPIIVYHTEACEGDPSVWTGGNWEEGRMEGDPYGLEHMNKVFRFVAPMGYSNTGQCFWGIERVCVEDTTWEFGGAQYSGALGYGGDPDAPRPPSQIPGSYVEIGFMPGAYVWQSGRTAPAINGGLGQSTIEYWGDPGVTGYDARWAYVVNILQGTTYAPSANIDAWMFQMAPRRDGSTGEPDNATASANEKQWAEHAISRLIDECTTYRGNGKVWIFVIPPCRYIGTISSQTWNYDTNIYSLCNPLGSHGVEGGFDLCNHILSLARTPGHKFYQRVFPGPELADFTSDADLADNCHPSSAKADEFARQIIRFFKRPWWRKAELQTFTFATTRNNPATS